VESTGQATSNDSSSAVDSDSSAIEHFLSSPATTPLLLHGDAVAILRSMPRSSVDMAITSPPYWGHRKYESGGIGEESSPEEYVEALLAVFHELAHVLKPTGSFWLNLGDTYRNKGLVGIPWRVALAMTDQQGWILRNDVIWNKLKGSPDNSKDKVRPVHEHLFHFVRKKKYYYNDDAVRQPPKKARVENGRVVSATGVRGVRYERQIELSSSLSDAEKKAARDALAATLQELADGKIADFRMVIRKQQRTTHSNSTAVSGRAKELEDKGFYFLRYHPKGAKIGDVWEILPESSQKRELHYAPFPEDLCKTPIIATCPPAGVVLDPFCGTGTAMRVARNLQRKSIGIDLSEEYLRLASERCGGLF